MMRHSRVIRIFISSTFADMQLERRLLQENIIPHFKKYCSKVGWQFEAVDLRWGISKQAAMNQSTIEICLNELERCKAVSPQPNFMILMGQRYGWRPLPGRITRNHFSDIMKIADDNGKQLLSKWYLADLNSKQQYYLLQPRRDLYTDNIIYEKQVYRPLHNLFNLFGKTLRPDEQVWYSGSATHQEIYSGAMHGDHDQVISFMRILDDIPSSESETYIGTDSEKNLIADLQKELLETIGDENVIQSRIPFDQYGSETYNTFFIDSIKNRLQFLIDQEIANYTLSVGDSEEMLNHQFWGEGRQELFIGREEELSILQKAVTKCNHPIWVTGDSGCGKTSLLAKFKILACQKSWLVFERYIGATSASTDVGLLLKGLLSEIDKYFFQEYKDVLVSMINENEVIHEFVEKINSLSSDIPVIFIFDGVDQLSSDTEGSDLSWIPRKLPKNVSIIISCATDFRHHPKQPLIRLDGLDKEQAINLVKQKLQTRDRNLTDQQWNIVNKAILDSNRMPFYLSNLSDIVSSWTSYESNSSLPTNENTLFSYMLTKLMLPENHGEKLVCMVLELITCSKHGLTNDELLEILGSDDDFWAYLNASAFHNMEEVSDNRRAIPSIYLSRLIHDMRSILSTFQNIGGVVYGFKHIFFRKYTEDEILMNEENRNYCYKLLADYFENRWSEPYIRALEEYPYSLTNLGDCEKLESLLTDFQLIQLKSQYKLLHSLHNDYNVARKISLNPLIEAFYFFIIKNSWLFEQYTAYYPEFVLQLASTDTLTEVSRLAKKSLTDKQHILTFLIAKHQNPSNIHPVFFQKRHNSEIRILKFLKGDHYFVSADFHNIMLYDMPSGMSRDIFSWEEYIYDVDTDAKCEIFVIGLEAKNIERAVIRKFYIDNALQNISNVVYQREFGKADEDFLYDNIVIWNRKDRSITKLTDPGATSVKRVAMTPDARYFFSASNKNLSLWEIDNNSYKVIRAIQDQAICVLVNRNFECQITPDGRFVLIGLYENTFCIYDMFGEKMMLHLDSKYCLHHKLHPVIFSVGFMSNQNDMVWVQTNTELVKINLDKDVAPSILQRFPTSTAPHEQFMDKTLNPCSGQINSKKYLILLSGTIRINCDAIYLYNSEGWEDENLWKIIWDVPGLSNLKSISSDEKYLLGGSNNGEICLYDLKTLIVSEIERETDEMSKIEDIIKSKDIFFGDSHPIFGNGLVKILESSIEFSYPNISLTKKLPIRSRGIFSVGRNGILCLGGTLVYYIDDKLNERIILNAKQIITACAILPDNEHAAFGNLDGEICIAPIFRKRQNFSATLTPHNDDVNYVLADHSGRYLISCGNDNFIVIFDVEFKREVFRHYSEIIFHYIGVIEENILVFLDKKNNYMIWKTNFDNYNVYPNFNNNLNSKKIKLLDIDPFEIKDLKN